jgi:hypothetical protein
MCWSLAHRLNQNPEITERFRKKLTGHTSAAYALLSRTCICPACPWLRPARHETRMAPAITSAAESRVAFVYRHGWHSRRHWISRFGSFRQ